MNGREHVPEDCVSGEQKARVGCANVGETDNAGKVLCFLKCLTEVANEWVNEFGNIAFFHDEIESVRCDL